MNDVLMRRLVGAGLLLLVAFVASLLLPTPQTEEPTAAQISVGATDSEPALQVYNVAVDAPPIPDQEEVQMGAYTPPTQALDDPGPAAEPDDSRRTFPLGADAAPNDAEAEPPAAEPAPESPPKAAPKPVPKPTPKPPSTATPAPSAAPKAQGEIWFVQAGSYSQAGNAEQAKSKIRSLGYPVSSVTVKTDKGTFHRVRSGPYASREAADSARARLQLNGMSASLVSDGG